MPKRIQRQRKKGWRMPGNTKCVTRPGLFGNPFATAAQYREVLESILIREPGKTYEPNCTIDEFCQVSKQAEQIEELRGLNLACFCPLNADCHADVLLELANRDQK